MENSEQCLNNIELEKVNLKGKSSRFSFDTFYSDISWKKAKKDFKKCLYAIFRKARQSYYMNAYMLEGKTL